MGRLTVVVNITSESGSGETRLEWGVPLGVLPIVM